MITEINPEINMGFLPIPVSNDDSADRLPVGVPNNWVLNKNSEHLEEAKTFLNWMVSSETGKRYITEEFAFIPAFDNIEPNGLGDLGESILEYSKAENDSLDLVQMAGWSKQRVCCDNPGVCRWKNRLRHCT